MEKWKPGQYRVDAVRAHLLEMAGDTKAALEHYRVAAGRTTSLPNSAISLCRPRASSWKPRGDHTLNGVRNP
jgi:hypothetical protein